jgi:formylglycine-generating enzyme required for sulfatase activity
VTVKQFSKFVEEEKYEWEGQDDPQGADNNPVVYVTWYDAMAYCQWLTKKLQARSETLGSLAILLRDGG